GIPRVYDLAPYVHRLCQTKKSRALQLFAGRIPLRNPHAYQFDTMGVFRMCLRNIAKSSQSLALVLVLVCCGSLSSFAQTSKGILAGVVKDGTGAVVSNATLTIRGEQTGETRNLTSG